jgi:hypothetical protein
VPGHRPRLARQPTESALTPPRPATGDPRSHDPGLREQIGLTRDAAIRLFDAHVALARAEAGPIIENIKGVAAAAGLAIGFGIFAALVVTVGLPLFMGEWIFGSLGWGILHSVALAAAIITICAWLIVVAEPEGVARAVAIGLILGLVVGVVFALDLTHRAWSALAEALAIATAPDGARLVVATIVAGLLGALAGLASGVIVFGLLGAISGRLFGRGSTAGGAAVGAAIGVILGLIGGLVLGALNANEVADRLGIEFGDEWWLLVIAGAIGAVVGAIVGTLLGAWRSGRSARDGLVLGTFLGLLLGAFTAVAFGPRVGAALGLLTALIGIAAAAGVALARHGVDEEKFKARFYPAQTIELTKETVEWLQQQGPMGPRT